MMENIYQAKTNQKNTGVAIVIWDKIDFRGKNITSDLENHFNFLKIEI